MECSGEQLEADEWKRYGWVQSYVGVCYDDDSSLLSSVVCDVELVVRDLFELEDVFVEDVTMNVCYGREQTPDGGVGVYKVGVVFTGLPCASLWRHGDGWSPDVSSLVHQRVYSQALGADNDLQVLQSIAAMKEVFFDDVRVVMIKQFFRSASDGGLRVRVPLERGSHFTCFRQSRSTAPCDVEEVESMDGEVEYAWRDLCSGDVDSVE